MKRELIKQIAEAGNTPAYVFDENILLQKISSVRTGSGNNRDIRLCYAMKANPFLVKVLEPYIDKYEVCSPGELFICKKQNIDMGKIVMSGVNKEKEDIVYALKWGVSVFTIESSAQLDLIQQCAVSQNKIVHVLLRLTSGNQFGMDRNNIFDIVEHREDFSNLSVKGIQFYSGTQKKVKRITEEIDDLCGFCMELKQKYQFEAEELEYGPGFGVDYFGKGDCDDDVPEECKEAFKRITDLNLKLTLEMGRFLVAECGSYITKVMDVKRNIGQNYCIVDGGIHHVNYYGQVMGARIPPIRHYSAVNNYEEELAEKKEYKSENICICGSLCTVADVLIRNISFCNVQKEDLFVFEKIGAYSVTEGIYLFLSRRLPKIYLLSVNGLELIRDSYETYQWNCLDEIDTGK